MIIAKCEQNIIIRSYFQNNPVSGKINKLKTLYICMDVITVEKIAYRLSAREKTNRNLYLNTRVS